MKYFYAYKITNTINNKIYIGKSNSNKNRFKDHLNVAKNKYSNKYSYVHKAINKYGKNNFIYEIIEKFDDEDAAYNAENKYILYYKSNNNQYGYNLNEGGRRFFTHSPETLKKISEQRKGFKFSTKSINKMRQSHLGQIASNRKFSSEEVLKIRNSYQEHKLLKLKIAPFINEIKNKYNCTRSCVEAIIYSKEYYKESLIAEIKNYNEKTCSKCHAIKNINSFNNDKRSKDGKCGHCRECEAIITSSRDKKIARDVIVNGNPMDIMEVFKDVVLQSLVSDEGRLTFTSY